MPTRPLIILVGPTAVGKTETAIRLAERLEAEIVSADSRLFYIGMDIGTAKPTLAERARVPHHLIDVARPDEPWSLTVFQKAATAAIESIFRRGRVPLLVGGTGQYIHAILEGWEIPKAAPDPRLRQALEKWSRRVTPSGLHQRLAVLDPKAAQSIDPQNLRRTVRALEVILSTGMPFSQQKSRSGNPYQTLMLGLYLPRQELYRRIDERIDKMLQAGLVQEVQDLLAKGYSPNLPTFSAIGYRQIILFLRGEKSLEEAVRLIKQQTRVFVRRQANWFKTSDSRIHWMDAGPEAVDQFETLARDWLAR
jgi:tRNA dimethylallyltransferase